MRAGNLDPNGAHFTPDRVVQDWNNEGAPVHHHLLTALACPHKGDLFGSALIEPPENDPEDDDGTIAPIMMLIVAPKTPMPCLRLIGPRVETS